MSVNVGLLLEMVAGADSDRVLVGSRAGGLTASLARAPGRGPLPGERSSECRLRGGQLDAPSRSFGAAFAGLPFAPLNYRLADEVLDRTARLAPGLVIADEAQARLAGHDGIEVLTISDLLARGPTPMRGEPLELPFVDPDEVAVLFTSGTTGEPKAALLRHRHVVSYIIGTVEFLGADLADAQLVSAPSYHIAGLAASSARCTAAGGSSTCLLDAEEWVRTVQAEAITCHGGADDAGATARGGRAGPRRAADAAAHLRGGGRMPIDLIERAMRLPTCQLRQRLRSHRRPARRSRSSLPRTIGRRGQRRPESAQAVGIGRPTRGVDRVGDPRSVRDGSAGRRVRGDLRAVEQVAGSTSTGALADDGWFPDQ